MCIFGMRDTWHQIEIHHHCLQEWRMNNIRLVLICCNVNICKNKLQKHCRANGNNHLRHLAENNTCDKFCSQYFSAQFPFESFGISICQRRSKCFDLAECALEKACLQRGGPSELSLGRANISTAPWKSINKAQTETYRGSRDKILRCVQGVGRGTTLRGRIWRSKQSGQSKKWNNKKLLENMPSSAVIYSRERSEHKEAKTKTRTRTRKFIGGIPILCWGIGAGAKEEEDKENLITFPILLSADLHHQPTTRHKCFRQIET